MGRKLFLTAEGRRRRIKTLMRQQGLSWYGLAKKTNRTPISIQRTIEGRNGNESDPRLSSLQAIAISLGVTVGFLVDNRETK